jgi:hypothetical protein
MLEYKRHFNAIGATTWARPLPFEQCIYPHWLKILTTFPHWTHTTIKFLLQHTRLKRVFCALVHKEQGKWLYLTLNMIQELLKSAVPRKSTTPRSKTLMR